MRREKLFRLFLVFEARSKLYSRYAPKRTSMQTPYNPYIATIRMFICTQLISVVSKRDVLDGRKNIELKWY